MQFLLYFSVVLVTVSLCIYFFMILHRDDSSVGHPTITHNIDEVKSVIPEFEIPEAQVKKVSDSNRDQQFSRSLKRIMGFDEIQPEEELIQKEIGLNDEPVQAVPLQVEQEYNHSYYQNLLREKEEDDLRLDTSEELIDGLKKDKINNLLRKAADLSSIEKNKNL